MPRVKSLNGYKKNQILHAADLYCTTRVVCMCLYPLRDQNQTIKRLNNKCLIVNRLPV